jgi:hypothetical protein
MNHTTTTLGIFAALAATMLMVGTAVIMPAFALISGDPQSSTSSNDGNTNTIFKNKGKAIASGFGSTALNSQSNCLQFLGAAPCPTVTLP